MKLNTRFTDFTLMVKIMYNDSVHNSGWFVIWALARCLRIIHSGDNSKGRRVSVRTRISP